MVVLVGGVRRKAILAWSSVGCDRRPGTNSYSKEHSTQKGGARVVSCSRAKASESTYPVSSWLCHMAADKLLSLYEFIRSGLDS